MLKNLKLMTENLTLYGNLSFNLETCRFLKIPFVYSPIRFEKQG